MKKKILIASAIALTVIVALAVVLIILLGGKPTPENEIYYSPDFKYTVLDDDSVRILAYIGDDTAVAVPSTIDGKPVSSIGEVAFMESDVKSVTLGLFVREICDAAFKDCKSLEAISLGDAIIAIAPYTFAGCTSLEKIVIPDTVTVIDVAAFSGAYSLKEVTMSNSVTEIKGSAFLDCEELTKIALPATCTSIGHSAFEGCTSLAEITGTESLATLGERAFFGCEALKSLSFGKEINYIGPAAFHACNSLESITVPADHTRYTTEGGALVNRVSKKVIIMPAKTDVTSYIVPDYVEVIEEYAFRNCLSLTEVTLPDGLKTIGTYAF